MRSGEGGKGGENRLVSLGHESGWKKVHRDAFPREGLLWGQGLWWSPFHPQIFWGGTDVFMPEIIGHLSYRPSAKETCGP